MTEPMCFCILCGCFYYALYELELCLKDFEENEEEIFPMRCAVMQICDHWSTRTKVVEDDDASWCQTSWLRPKFFFQLPLGYIEMKNHLNFNINPAQILNFKYKIHKFI